MKFIDLQEAKYHLHPTKVERGFVVRSPEGEYYTKNIGSSVRSPEGEYYTKNIGSSPDIEDAKVWKTRAGAKSHALTWGYAMRPRPRNEVIEIEIQTLETRTIVG
jgi:hypothetical protein